MLNSFARKAHVDVDAQQTGDKPPRGIGKVRLVNQNDTLTTHPALTRPQLSRLQLGLGSYLGLIPKNT